MRRNTLKPTVSRLLKIAVVVAVSVSLNGCDNVRVYGSVGYSSYNGYGGPGRFGTSVSIGGRIY
ncbi:MAG: hypothetical protein AAFN78_05280 [Pseudomonadota bacterium]